MSPLHTETRPQAPQAAQTTRETAVPGQRTRQAPLRLHTDKHEPPPARRVFGVTFWAAACILVGLIPAGRLVASIAFQSLILHWYQLTVASTAMLGLLLIMSAFAAIHRARLPWYLMTIATLLLAVNVAMVYVIRW